MEILKGGSFKDGVYVKLHKDGYLIVNKMAEKIHVSTRFLLLSSDKIYSRSRQKLLNDIFKRKDRYH